jgi:hypothetical protein
VKEQELDSRLAACLEPAPRRYFAENATEADLAALRAAVFEYEPGIVYWYESEHQTPWSVDQMWTRRKELTTGRDSFVVIVDLSRAGRPDAEARQFLKIVAADPKVSYFSVFTEKNILINAVARFVFSSVMPKGKFTLTKSRSDAIATARERAAGGSVPGGS